MDTTQVEQLTHQKMAEFRKSHRISAIAEECLNSNLRHFLSPYVFWSDDGTGRAKPIFGLDAAVFDAFGLVWSELVAGYSDLIMVDGDADRESITCQIKR